MPDTAPIRRSPAPALHAVASEDNDAEHPQATRPTGGAEISFTEADKASLLATYDAWQALGLTILQSPTEMDFGFTFTAEDPDGHRLRPFVRAENPR